MSDKKYYLDEIGLEKLIAYVKAELNKKMNKNEAITLPEDLVTIEDLEPYATKALLNNYINDTVLSSILTDYAKKTDIESDYATNETLQNAIDDILAQVSGVYHFKGNVDNLIELQAIENPALGDVYNLRDTGMNAAWNGEVWDDFGSIVDLSPYAKNEDIQAIAITDIYNILYSGKEAIVSDYEGINAMMINNEPNIEITFDKDIALTKAISIPSGKNAIIDLDGNNLNGNVQTLINVAGGNVTIKNGNVIGANRTVIVSGGELTLENANIVSTSDCAISASGVNSNVIINSGKVTAQEAGVLVTTGASLEVNGGEIEGLDNSPIMGNGTNGQGNINITMNSGKLIAHIQSNGYIACGVYMPNSGTFTMNGGEIISDGAGIVMRGGQVNLNNGSVIANGESGVTGKVGDSRQVVGPYAIVYDANSKYPAMDTLELNISENIILQGTDGDIQYIPNDNTANVNDYRV